MSDWNPCTHPYRVIAVFQSSASYHHGWRYGPTKTFATYEEAVACANEKQGKGLIKITVDQAMNPETWTKNGYWKKLASRKRGGQIQ